MAHLPIQHTAIKCVFTSVFLFFLLHVEVQKTHSPQGSQPEAAHSEHTACASGSDLQPGACQGLLGQGLLGCAPALPVNKQDPHQY